MFLAKIHVTLKPSILDPQGTAVCEALHAMGYSEVKSLRLGKYLELQLNGEKKAEVERRIEKMCKQLLANLVIESYEFNVQKIPV